jgi:hypothetical protein
MRKMLQAAATSIVAAGMLSLIVGPTGPASADSVCNGVAQNGGDGEICLDYHSSGYRALYRWGDNSNGDWMDFNLACDSGRRFGSDAAFLTNYHAHGYKVYVFRVGSQGRCHAVIHDRSVAGESSSPSVTR